MAFQRPTLAELVDRIQADLVSRLALTGSVLRRSVVAVFARVFAGVVHLLHGHIEWASRQIFTQTMDAEYLDRDAELVGLTRIAATFATGNATFTGTNGSIIPAGTVLVRSDGLEYTTNAQGTVSAGTATVAITARTAGYTGNADAGTVLQLNAPVTGVNQSVSVAAGGLANGIDEEDDAALRARILERKQAPPHGGAEADYISWAKEVAGVTRVWVYPQELGPGKVTVRFMTDDLTATGIPSAGKVTEVQNYINARRPVTATVNVVAPVSVALNITIASLVPATQAVKDAIAAELKDMLRRDAQPGGTILISRIREAVSIAAGESDHSVTVPAGNVTHTTGQIATLGTITYA